MKYSNDKMKQLCMLIAEAALLIFLIINSDMLLSVLSRLLRILLPFLLGGAMAYILNLPMRCIEKKVFGNAKSRVSLVLKRPVSILLSLMLVLLIICGVAFTVVPQVAGALSEIADHIPIYAQKLDLFFRESGLGDSLSFSQLQDGSEAALSVLQDPQKLADSLFGLFGSGLGSILGRTVGMAGNIVSSIAKFFVAFVFAIYILGQKEKLSAQVHLLFSVYLPEQISERILHIFGILNRSFTSFITGQCIEAIILGLLFVISMSILRMPYAVLVGVLIAFTALLPIVGAFIGCFVGALLILLEAPDKALWFLVLFICLQQFEGNVIYPKVVGSSVGLPSIWVLAAVSIGGSLFGVIGMLVFIPLFSTVYALIREDVYARLDRADTVHDVQS